MDTLVTYLWGLSLGAVLFGIVMATLLAVPIIMDPNMSILVRCARFACFGVLCTLHALCLLRALHSLELAAAGRRVACA